MRASVPSGKFAAHIAGWSMRLVMGALVLLGGLAAEGQESERTVTGGEVFHGVLQYRAKDAKLALVRPSFATAEAAALPAGVSVVGVTVNGEHRAYPLYVMKNHQVINDRLGGVPIAASW